MAAEPWPQSLAPPRRAAGGREPEAARQILDPNEYDFPLVVLGDFNRRMNIDGDDMWADLDDGDPGLTKHTDGLTSECMNFRLPEYIDRIVTARQ